MPKWQQRLLAVVNTCQLCMMQKYFIVHSSGICFMMQKYSYEGFYVKCVKALYDIDWEMQINACILGSASRCINTTKFCKMHID